MKKRSILITCIISLVALLIWSPNCPALYCGDYYWCNTPDCGDKIEECDYSADPTGCEEGEVCTNECICESISYCGDNMVNQASEECDGTDAEACPGECLPDCTCPETPPGNCEPMTQGFWKRICDGVDGYKQLHPETPENFVSGDLCDDLQVRGNIKSDPCIRAASQAAALQLNIAYGYLDVDCEIEYPEGDEMSAADALVEVMRLIAVGDCKGAADLAESINSRKAL